MSDIKITAQDYTEWMNAPQTERMGAAKTVELDAGRLVHAGRLLAALEQEVRAAVRCFADTFEPELDHEYESETLKRRVVLLRKLRAEQMLSLRIERADSILFELDRWDLLGGWHVYAMGHELVDVMLRRAVAHGTDGGATRRGVLYRVVEKRSECDWASIRKRGGVWNDEGDPSECHHHFKREREAALVDELRSMMGSDAELFEVLDNSPAEYIEPLELGSLGV